MVAGMAMSGVYLTNWSVAYISYATRMVFKSSKVLPVMLVGAVMMGKRYSVAEVAAGECPSHLSSCREVDEVICLFILCNYPQFTGLRQRCV
jgi:hypothetical protein